MTTTANQANSGSSGEIVAGAILGCRLVKTNRKMAVVSGGIVASVLCLVSPVQALQVQVSPPNPELGDTLSVLIQVDGSPGETPTVSLQQKNYPAFPMGNNRFRALLPTTPLEKPGTRQIQVSGDGQVQNLSVQVRSRNFPTQSITLPPGKDGEGTDAEFDRVD
ncbi:MAG: M23 family peptidase, partial [Oscillatoriales cyanobacterium]